MNKIKRIAILGSTGSIGTQTLQIIRKHSDRYRATVLVAGSNVQRLVEQAIEFKPALVVIADTSKYAALRDALAPLGIDTAAGEDACADAVVRSDVDMVVTATVGYSGLRPTIRAIEAGKDIALANKETMVVAGAYVTNLLKSSKSRIYPVDSEHSAIYQCLKGEDATTVKRLIITASGGPFRTWSAEQISKATAADALRHPNWTMGPKITIDSATLLNKAFEIIEARWLFDISPAQIEAIVHPQSIIHSMVEFIDGAIKAQMGVPEMLLPIAYALGEAQRVGEVADFCDLLTKHRDLTFEAPDVERFPCLKFAKIALESGGTTACAINAANEVANLAFREDKIGFNDIYHIINETIGKVHYVSDPTYSDYVQVNSEARAYAEQLVNDRHNGYLLD